MPDTKQHPAKPKAAGDQTGVRMTVLTFINAGDRPESGQPGELWINVADRLIGSFDREGLPVVLDGSRQTGQAGD